MRVVWLLLCDDQRPVSRGFRTVRDQTLCSETEKSQVEWQTGCSHISAHSCESTMSTSDNHNVLVRTPIRVFLDFTESLLSLKFYKMKCSAKPWSEHWVRSWTVEEWSVLVFGTSELVCISNAWGCVWPEQGNACWMFCVEFTKAGHSGLSPNYF